MAATKKNTFEKLEYDTEDVFDRIRYYGFHAQAEIDAVYAAARALVGNVRGNIDLVARLLRPATAEVLERCEEIQRRHRI